MKKFLLFLSALTLSCTVSVKTPAGRPSRSRISISPYFSPRGGCTQAIIEQIDRAKRYVDVAIYSFTSRKIAKALIRAKRRGVKVKVIIDEGNAKSRRCVAPLLERAGIAVRVKRGSGGGLMHNKFAVIDDKVVITGSFNWTVSAEKRNDENLVVIKGSKKVVSAFKKRFEKLWRLAHLED